MEPRALYRHFINSLTGLYDQREATSITRLVFEEVTGLPVLSVQTANPYLPDILNRLNSILKRLHIAEPVQYVLGIADFAGIKIGVGPGVLIPRPETVEMVEHVCNELADYDSPRVLDACTGSGCIACAIAVKLPNSTVDAFDISLDALAIAQANSLRNNAGIWLQQLDLYKAKAQHFIHAYDVLVANPPYIPQKNAASMHQNVLAHEPSLALFVEDATPLAPYKAIAELGWLILKTGGSLWLECYSELAIAVQELAQRHGYQDVMVLQDNTGRDRFVSANKPN